MKILVPELKNAPLDPIKHTHKQTKKGGGEMVKIICKLIDDLC